MATPIRAIPVLEGEVARRFLREMKKAEKERGTIDFSQQRKNYNLMLQKAREKGTINW
jgi:hypothetical protein